MNYHCFNIQIAQKQVEILIALLDVQGFEAFEETETGVKAFLSAEQDVAAATQALEELQRQFSFSYTEEVQREQNWNAVWESNFQPIQIGDFCGVRASFHPPMPAVQHEIVIQPKMSFGTGHHATTHMMIELMQNIDFEGKKVWDFGSGTGILAILAAKLGATTVVANDISAWAYENALENIATNQTPAIQVLHGGIEVVPRQLYDKILANITLDVISPALLTLYNQLANNGDLVVSGFLQTDIESLSAKATTFGLRLHSRRTLGEWVCLHFKK